MSTNWGLGHLLIIKNRFSKINQNKVWWYLTLRSHNSKYKSTKFFSNIDFNNISKYLLIETCFKLLLDIHKFITYDNSSIIPPRLPVLYQIFIFNNKVHLKCYTALDFQYFDQFYVKIHYNFWTSGYEIFNGHFTKFLHKTLVNFRLKIP